MKMVAADAMTSRAAIAHHAALSAASVTDLDIWSLSQSVQGVSTVFAAAPGQPYAFGTALLLLNAAH